MRTSMTGLAIVFTILLGLLGPAQGFPDNTAPHNGITDGFKEALRHDARIDAHGITVSTMKGIVTLSGNVMNLAAKRYAGPEAKKINGGLGVINTIAVMPNFRRDKDIKNDAGAALDRDVVGVGWVTNNLSVHTGRRNDWAIRDDVEVSIATDIILDGSDIGVKVKDGVVTLYGITHTMNEKSHAEDLAARVRGVIKIVNTINVDQRLRYSDVVLARLIRSALKWNWSTYRVHDKIHVMVQNGVARLTGAVDKWSERREAGEIASNTEGIKTVDNRLTVHNDDDR